MSSKRIVVLGLLCAAAPASAASLDSDGQYRLKCNGLQDIEYTLSRPTCNGHNFSMKGWGWCDESAGDRAGSRTYRVQASWNTLTRKAAEVITMDGAPGSISAQGTCTDDPFLKSATCSNVQMTGPYEDWGFDHTSFPISKRVIWPAKRTEILNKLNTTPYQLAVDIVSPESGHKYLAPATGSFGLDIPVSVERPADMTQRITYYLSQTLPSSPWPVLTKMHEVTTGPIDASGHGTFVYTTKYRATKPGKWRVEVTGLCNNTVGRVHEHAFEISRMVDLTRVPVVRPPRP